MSDDSAVPAPGTRPGARARRPGHGQEQPPGLALGDHHRSRFLPRRRPRPETEAARTPSGSLTAGVAPSTGTLPAWGTYGVGPPDGLLPEHAGTRSRRRVRFWRSAAAGLALPVVVGLVFLPAGLIHLEATSTWIALLGLVGTGGSIATLAVLAVVWLVRLSTTPLPAPLVATGPPTSTPRTNDLPFVAWVRVLAFSLGAVVGSVVTFIPAS